MIAVTSLSGVIADVGDEDSRYRNEHESEDVEAESDNKPDESEFLE